MTGTWRCTAPLPSSSQKPKQRTDCPEKEQRVRISLPMRRRFVVTNAAWQRHEAAKHRRPKKLKFYAFIGVKKSEAPAQTCTQWSIQVCSHLIFQHMKRCRPACRGLDDGLSRPFHNAHTHKKQKWCINSNKHSDNTPQNDSYVIYDACSIVQVKLVIMFSYT